MVGEVLRAINVDGLVIRPNIEDPRGAQIRKLTSAVRTLCASLIDIHTLGFYELQRRNAVSDLRTADFALGTTRKLERRTSVSTAICNVLLNGRH